MRIWRRWLSAGLTHFCVYALSNVSLVVPRLRRGHPFAWPSVVVLAGMVIAVLAVVWWRDEKYTIGTCTILRPQVATMQDARGYIEFALKKQDPIEPVVESTLFIGLFKAPDPPPSEVTVWRSPIGSYGRPEAIVPLKRVRGGAAGMLGNPTGQDFSLLSLEGLHRNFPFDSRPFALDLGFSMDLPADMIRLTNRIPGFSLPCKPIHTSWVSASRVQIRFYLDRNRLISLFAIVFVGVALVFPLIIIRLANVSALATSVASYFLSVWSLRRILESELRVFPTLFDAMLLGLSMLMLVLLVFRVALSRFQQAGDANRTG